MVSAFRPLTIALLVLLGSGPAALANDGARHIRGLVCDESKAVLPGVTIVVTAADATVLATAVTDGAGHYDVGPLRAEPVTVRFELEGFSAATVPVAPAETDAVVNQCLALASRSESVEVVGKLPVPLPLPSPPVPFRPTPRPKPVIAAVPDHDREAVCGPASLGEAPRSFGTVRSRRSAANQLYAAGDELVVDGGTAAGLTVGRNFVVRRTFRIEWDPRTEIAEHTAGLVQIVSAEEKTAVAVVIYACDEMLPGDRLAAFQPQARRAPLPPGTPDYRRAAKILFPDIGQMVGAPRRLMVIDRGAGSGIRVGQHVTLFRRREFGEGTPIVVGDAIVVAVRIDSATIRVEHVSDAIMFGDWAAPQR